MPLNSLELQQRPISTPVCVVPTPVGIAPTGVFGSKKMFSGIETIFSMAETAVEVPETMFSAVGTMVWTIQTIFFLVQTIVGLTQKHFSEAEPIFYASKTGFSTTQKNAGEGQSSSRTKKDLRVTDAFTYGTIARCPGRCPFWNREAPKDLNSCSVLSLIYKKHKENLHPMSQGAVCDQ